MKSLKFRAWDGEVMHENVNINQGRGVVRGYQWFNTSNTISENDHVMQFTGLQDKDGVDIYDGDIVRARWINLYDERIICECFWNEEKAQFMFKLIDYMEDRYPPEDHDPDILIIPTELFSHKIIGNIHQHPELLEAS